MASHLVKCQVGKVGSMRKYERVKDKEEEEEEEKEKNTSVKVKVSS